MTRHRWFISWLEIARRHPHMFYLLTRSAT